MKIKLSPSEKIKRRYLFLSAKNREIVEKIILDYIGILGWAKSSPQFINSEKGLILAIERSSLETIRAAFEMSKEKIKILKVSGTLKGLNIS